jgi:hypothetical protein
VQPHIGTGSLGVIGRAFNVESSLALDVRGTGSIGE